MPIIFDCTLQCDAEGCESEQKAIARYEGPSITLGLLPIGSPTSPFAIQYDRASKLDWNMLGFGKMACSKACQVDVAAQVKKEETKQARTAKKHFPEVVAELKSKKEG